MEMTSCEDSAVKNTYITRHELRPFLQGVVGNLESVIGVS